jgi:hypothetical protein
LCVSRIAQQVAYVNEEISGSGFSYFADYVVHLAHSYNDADIMVKPNNPDTL